jgi:hypothetical protein
MMTLPDLKPATHTPNQEFNRLASDEEVEQTARSLEVNGFHTVVLDTGEQASDFVWKLIPTDSEVYDPPSQTLQQIGLLTRFETQTGFRRLRLRLLEMDRKTQAREIRRLISSPDVVIGSVHAITQQGQVMLASASGSQLVSAVFGAGTVIWVVGTQKIVPTLEHGFRRIREYSYPMEDARAKNIYGRPSAINKILILNGENPGRITIVLVKQNLGF